MVGIDKKLFEHGFNIKPRESMMKQKKRGRTGERNKVINLEVTKLMDVNILHEAFSPYR